MACIVANDLCFVCACWFDDYYNIDFDECDVILI